MTLRSRKKPPTTAQNRTATATSTSIDTWEYPVGDIWNFDFQTPTRGEFSTASTVAIVIAVTLFCLVIPARSEQNSGAQWKPTRQSLSSAAVPQVRKQARSLSTAKLAAKSVQKPAATQPSQTSQTHNWKTASHLENTSTHLQWRKSPPQQQSLKSVAKSAPKPRVRQAAQPIAKATSNRASLRSTEMPRLIQPSVSKSVKQVQYTEDLKLPFGFGEADLISAKAAAQSNAFTPTAPSAPSPEDVFTSPHARSLQNTNPYQFKDQTPVGTEAPAQTQSLRTQSLRTRQVQSIFDPFEDDPVDAEPLPDPTGPSPQPNAAEPLSTPRPNFGDLRPEPISPPDSSAPDSTVPAEQEFQFGQDSNSDTPFDLTPSDEPSTSGAFSTTQSVDEDDDEDIQSAVQRQLDQLDTLPPVPGSGDDGPPVPGEDDNPLKLFDGEDEDKEEAKSKLEEEAQKAELAGTNGRECNNDASKADFAYLRRRERTDMSLNITPLIEPTEVDMGKVEQTRIEKLAKAPSKRWMNRAGNVIAEGYFDDFRNDKVYVRTINGAMRAIPHHTLSDTDRCFVNAWWELPDERNFEGERYEVRDYRLTTFTWVAAATCHKPLYFEQVGIERQGHSAGPIAQPLISGVHFFGDIVMLPYHTGLNPPNECVYTLGHYRPGDCAPWLMPGFPFSSRAFKWEGLAIGAAIALMP